MFYGWYIVGSAFVVAMYGFGLGFYGPGLYLAALRDLHGWPTALLSSAVTLYYLCSATWIIFVGGVIERFGPRRVVLVGCCTLGAGVVLLSAVEAPWQVFVAFVVMSFGWATMSGAAINAIVAPWFEKKRGLAISLALNGASCGGVFVAPLLVLLMTEFQFQRGLHFAVAGMLAVMVPALLTLRRRPEDLGLRPDGELPAGEGQLTTPGPVSQTGSWTRRAAFRDRAFLTVSIPFALGLLAQVGFLTHQFSYLLQFVEAPSASLVVSLTTAAAVTGRTVTGFFIDRLNRRVVSAANFALQTAGLGLLLFATTPLLVGLGCLLFGLGVGNTITLPSLIVQDEFPRQDFSKIVSLVVSVNQFTFSLGPAILGGLRDWSGDYRASLLVCMGLLAVAALIVLLGRQRAEAAAAA